MQQVTAEQYAQMQRLTAITQSIGFALWQLQELEGMAAQYLVLRTKALPGMGLAAGNELFAKAQNRPFGFTLREIAGAGLFEPSLQARFDQLLAERNWLVHKSRAASRPAVHSDGAARSLVVRVGAMAEQAKELLSEIASLVEAFVKQYGVTQEQVDREVQAVLRGWHDPNAT